MTAEQPDYFTYFPTHYRWSAEILAMLGTAPYGGADIGEVDRVGRQLRACVGDDEQWFLRWSAAARQMQGRAAAAEGASHLFTASSLYLRACAEYQHAEHFRHPKDAAALDAFQSSLDCFAKFIELTDRPRIERVEIAYRYGRLPAYFVRAEGGRRVPAPCVLRFGGFDTQKELQYLRGVGDLARRGFSVLVVDGPGMGESIRFRGIKLHADYERVGSACLDYLAGRADVDPDRIGIVALSLGGYFAPRCAALDHRFKACVAWAAQWDVHATWARRLELIERGQAVALPVPIDHVRWVFGVDTFDQALQKLKDFKLDGIVQSMRCPFLLTHGSEDKQTPMADAHKLFAAVGSQDKTFRIFTPEEGGAQHCQRDYLIAACDTIGDWLEDKLM